MNKPSNRYSPLLWAALLLTLALSGCGEGGAGAASDGAGGLIPWQTQFTLAQQQARTQHKPLFLDFGADWCPPCQEMKKHVFTNPRVASLIAHRFIPVRVDLTDNQAPGVIALAQRFHINPIPALIVVDAQGREIARQEGYLDPRDLVAWLQQYAPPATQPAS